MTSVQRSLYRNEATNDYEIIKTEVPDGVDGQTRDMLERCMTGRAAGTRTKMRSRARKEASAQEVRGYYKQFAEAKHLESRSWVDNKVFDLMDLRQVTPRNYVTGRWVQSYDVNRDVVCQLPPEQGHPPYIAVRLKKTAYGMNDAPRRWWNILDNALCSYGMVPAGADRCCYVLFSINSRERTWNQGDSSQCENKNNISIKPSHRIETDDPYDRMQDPSASSPATEKTVAGKTIFLKMISLEQVELEKISKLVLKTGMM